MGRSGYALYTIRFSHYNERARWALDRYQARAFLRLCCEAHGRRFRAAITRP